MLMRTKLLLVIATAIGLGAIKWWMVLLFVLIIFAWSLVRAARDRGDEDDNDIDSNGVFS